MPMLEQSTKKSGSRQRPWSAGRIRGASPIAPTSVAVHFKHHRHISRPDPCSPKSTFLDREVNAIMQGQFVDDHTRSTCPACTTLNAERCSYCLRGKSSTAPRMHLHELGALLIQAAKEKKSNKKPKSTEDKRQVVSKVEALNSGRPSTPMTPKSPKQELCGPDVLTPESLLKTLVLYGRSSEFALEMNEKLNWPKRSSIAVHQQSRKWCVKHYDQYDDAAQYTAGLEKERSDNKAILKKSRKKLLEKKVEIIDALQRIQDLESLLAEEQLKTQELTKRNDSLGIYVDRASRDRSRIDQLERRNRQLTAELNDKKQQLYELEDLKEEIEGINVLHGQITTLDTENVELKSKLNATFLDLEAANQIIADAREATPRNPCRCDELHCEVESLKRRLSENICAQCGCAIDEIDKRPQNKSEAKKRPNKKMSVTAKKNHALTDGTDHQLLDQRCRSSKLLCPLGRLVPKNAEKKSAPVPPKSCQKEMYEVLEKKILADIADECADKEKKSLPEFLDDYFQSKFGLKKMADDKLKAFLQSLVRHQVDVDKAEAKGGDDGVKANRRYCFLLDALCLKNERLWSRDTSGKSSHSDFERTNLRSYCLYRCLGIELLCLLLRRAFHSNIQSMSERLDDGPHKCFVPLDTALDMVYGDVAKRGDAGRWDNVR